MIIENMRHCVPGSLDCARDDEEQGVGVVR